MTIVKKDEITDKDLKVAEEKSAEAIDAFDKERFLNDVFSDKQLRKNLDVELQVLKLLPGSRERALAITKLQECIMWLGMDLKRLNEPNPYPNSYAPENAIIDKTADGLTL